VETACWLLFVQGVIGAFDTFYYHEWRARLPAGVPGTAPELQLHAARDFLYAVLFGTLPWVSWEGLWVWALVAVIVGEIVLTLWDFVIEVVVRKPLGDVYAGERVTHAVMGILYGAMLAFLIPTLVEWRSLPTRLALTSAPLPPFLLWSLSVMAVGVFLSGVRDLYASFGGPHAAWPWKPLSPDLEPSE
jgi:hypothetical protein